MSTALFLTTDFARVRAETERRAEPLSPEDRSLQSMPEYRPTKWHLAHTTWFFETFVLAPAGFPPIDGRYGYLWNSYYDALGPRHARPHRGLLSRPPAEEVARYRAAIDERLEAWLASGPDEKALGVLELGLAHEQQHQERKSSPRHPWRL